MDRYLIIDMKRCNAIWGEQRISDELNLMGMHFSKKTALKILRENNTDHFNSESIARMAYSAILKLLHLWSFIPCSYGPRPGRSLWELAAGHFAGTWDANPSEHRPGLPGKTHLPYALTYQ